ncbi:excitatory amino acid transporter 1-like [Amphiura filiformis]|uniref:excitatory amino acid transporter 1-like n=1 Tax=Amphiura filiformis TaxID=82378 RepID=UPI003B2179A7
MAEQVSAFVTRIQSRLASIKKTLTIEEIEDGGEKGKRAKMIQFWIFCRANLLIVLLLISLLIGTIIGFSIKLGSGKEYTKEEIDYISFPGTLFLNSLKMVIIPLIVSSLIAGMASLDKQSSGKLGGKAILYYFTTTFIAVILGMIVVAIIKPGKHGKPTTPENVKKMEEVDTVYAFMDLLRNLIPPNIVQACFQTYKTSANVVEVTKMNLTAESGVEMNDSTKELEFAGKFEDKTNILGLVVFSILFGTIIGRMEKQGEPVRMFVNSFMEAIMKIVSIIIWFTPIGVFFLILGKILEMDDWETTFQQIGLFCLTVMLGLALHAFIALPLLYFIFTRKNPVTVLVGVAPALMTAFATASSSATLPITLTSLEENLGIDRRVTRFVLPIGATINMDGTALYEAVGAIFIAQLNSATYSLTLSKVVAISITATLASVGAAGVPQAGLVTMVIVLNAVGLPIDDIALILVIDWLLDRCRTTINVWGDSIGTVIIYERSKDDLEHLPGQSEDKTNDDDDIALDDAITGV